MKKTIAFLLFASTAFADPCTTLSTVGFKQPQIEQAHGIAAQISVASDPQAGNTSVTQGAGTITICNSNPQFDASVITIPALVAQYNANVAARAAAKAQSDAWSVQLATTTTALNNARIIGYKNLTAANKDAFVQGLADREYLKIQLGIDEK